MLIFIALVYFCLACSGIWLVLFPSGREFLGQVKSEMSRRWDQRAARWSQPRSAPPATPVRDGRRWFAHRLKFVRRHALLFGAGATLVVVPTMLAVLMSNPGMLPGYEARIDAPDQQIAALLQGEQLAPPVALPPVAFTTLEVELVRPMLVDASRNWTQLNPDFSQRLLMAFKIMKEKHGYEMALLEGYRSPARQNLLASMGSNVTNAGAFQSWHQYGLAADCAFWRDGKLLISEKHPWAMRGYRLYGEVAESLGLTWGGRWTMMDFGHTELRVRGVMRK
ncbi:M15 family metallopeptidase [Massilia sp. TWR1-2-2]|uniref:M15 family metallopeptidase n=1 Tax=Massilia sp. TWR1-2-2 TaxID=2804584 RepID=UPI003CFA123D